MTDQRLTMRFKDRHAERAALIFDAPLRELARDFVTVRVEDISRTGFSATCALRLSVGAQIVINLPGLGDANGQIMWTRRGRIGGRFTIPIDAARVIAAVKAG